MNAEKFNMWPSIEIKIYNFLRFIHFYLIKKFIEQIENQMKSERDIKKIYNLWKIYETVEKQLKIKIFALHHHERLLIVAVNARNRNFGFAKKTKKKISLSDLRLSSRWDRSTLSEKLCTQIEATLGRESIEMNWLRLETNCNKKEMLVWLVYDSKE